MNPMTPELREIHDKMRSEGIALPSADAPTEKGAVSLVAAASTGSVISDERIVQILNDDNEGYVCTASKKELIAAMHRLEELRILEVQEWRGKVLDMLQMCAKALTPPNIEVANG